MTNKVTNKLNNKLIKIAGGLFVGMLVLFGARKEVNAASEYEYFNGSTTAYADTLSDAVANAADNSTITLLADVTDSTIVVINSSCGAQLTLDLNGHTITATGAPIPSGPNAFLNIDENYQFTIEDNTNGKLGEITEGTGGSLKHAVYNKGTLVLNSGSITNFSSTADYGGGLYCQYANSYFTMNGGSITGCTISSTLGGGIALNDGAHFTMNGGNISYCTAGNGGGLYVGNGSRATLNGGTITNCYADFSGGGVYMAQTNNPTIEIKGDTYIINNTCSVYAGDDKDEDNLQVYVNPSSGASGTVIITGDLTGEVKINSSAPNIKFANNQIYSGLENLIFVKNNGDPIDSHLTISATGQIGVVSNAAGTTLCTVIFNMNGHGTNESVQYETGSRVMRPNDPTATGYDFEGWYKNTNFTEEWKFYDEAGADIIPGGTTSVTLYAKWGGGTTSATGDYYIDELYEKLNSAISLGGEQTVIWDEGDTLSYDVMKILQDNPAITLRFSYTYENVDYNVTLHGKDVKAFTNIPWYGPLYLNAYYGEDTANRTYTVVAGDSLTGLAIKLKTSVKSLVYLNNIKNPDKINIGQVLKY